eukprot:3302247-Rhodomonas_salina.1
MEAMLLSIEAVLPYMEATRSFKGVQLTRTMVCSVFNFIAEHILPLKESLPYDRPPEVPPYLTPSLASSPLSRPSPSFSASLPLAAVSGHGAVESQRRRSQDGEQGHAEGHRRLTEERGAGRCFPGCMLPCPASTAPLAS